MAEFQYYSGEETAQGPKSTQTGAPAPPPNALQFLMTRPQDRRHGLTPLTRLWKQEPWRWTLRPN